MVLSSSFARAAGVIATGSGLLADVLWRTSDMVFVLSLEDENWTRKQCGNGGERWSIDIVELFKSRSSGISLEATRWLVWRSTS